MEALIAQRLSQTCSPHVKLEESFNVPSLQKFANLELELTNDLLSHLNLRNDDKKVLAFHRVTFLEAMNE